jgi:MraZ protein
VFWGRHKNSIDDKGRLVLPARWRQDLEHGFFVCPGWEPCLVVLPMERWLRARAKLAEAKLGDAEAERLQRHLGDGFEARLDGAGRVLLPTNLRDKAKLSGEVLLCGVFNRIEIWNQELRQQYDEANLTNEGLREAFKSSLIDL